MKKVLLAILAFLVFIPFYQAYAHQSGCHRWHSCPSDTGSYVCGDLGYTSGCPKVVPVAPPIKKTAPALKKIPVKTSVIQEKIYVKGYYRKNGTYVNGYWRNK